MIHCNPKRVPVLPFLSFPAVLPGTRHVWHDSINGFNSHVEVLMRKSSVAVICVLALISLASEAGAQWAPLNGRLVVSINGGVQPVSQDVGRSTTFVLYDESVTVETAQTINSGGLFDVGAALRISGRFGLGVAYSQMQSTGSATISGTLPHPLFFDRPRPLSAPADGLDHREQAVHVQALFLVPFVEKVDFVLSAGPSFFKTHQDFARGVSFSEVPPDFTSVTIDAVDIATYAKNSVGFNVGVDATYMVSRMFGVGAMVRYTRSPVTFELGEGQTAALKSGNIQLGAGLRLRF